MNADRRSQRGRALDSWRALAQYFDQQSDDFAGIGTRARQANATGTIGVVVGGIFSLFNLFTPGMFALGMTELCAVVFLLAPAVWLSRYPRRVALSEAMITMATVTILGALVVFGGVGGTGIFWAYLAPFLAFFLKGQRKGWWYSVIFFLLATVYLLGLQQFVPFGYDYPAITRVHFLLSLAFYTTVAAAFNRLTSHFAEQLRQKVQELTEAQSATQKALEEAEKARQATAQVIWSANLGAWELNLATQEVHYDKRCSEFLGLPYGEPAASRVEYWSGRTHTGDWAAAQAALRACMRGDTDVYENESRSRHTNGQWVWLLDRGRVIERDANGKPLKLAGTRQDITARKNADERQLHAVLEASPDAMLLVATNGQIRFANRVASVMFGYTNAQLMGLEVEQLVPAATRHHHAGLREKFHAAPSARQMGASQRLSALRRDGSEFPVEIGLSPFQLHGETVVIATVSDITERRQSEQNLRELNETLEQRVRQRTEQLGLALERAEAAKRSRGEFLANMSHEIRTPMNAVLGMVYLAMQTQPGSPLREYLQKIQTAGTHLIGIISTILDFSKIDSGKIDLEASSFDTREMLQNVLQLVELRAREKGLTLELVVADDVPTHLLGDRLRLSQIIINYLNNAIKFTQQGTVGLHVMCAPQGKLRFEVRDTGIGLTEAQMQRLFQPFEQADNTTTRMYGGTGLGLAICKQLAELMDGEVGVDSVVGKGSTFWFTVRIPEALAPEHPQELVLAQPPSTLTAQAPHAQPALPEMPPAQDDNVARMRVLVVDDSAFNLDVAEGILRSFDMDVVLASNGLDALQWLADAPFDAVLMDMHMPRMDGLETTRRLRASARNADVPVIGLTANVDREAHALCRAAGMTTVLTKPIDPELLKSTLLQGAETIAWPVSAPAPLLELSEPAPANTPASPLPVLGAGHLPLWDRSALIRTVGNSPAMHQRITRKYLVNCSALLTELQQACANSDWTEAASIAHKLKSAARTVGAMQVAALADAIELAGRQKDGACVLQNREHLTLAEITFRSAVEKESPA